MEDATMDRLWTYKDLALRWGPKPDVPMSIRQTKRICANWDLKPLKGMGHKTARFRPMDVMRAEERAAGASTRKSAAVWRPKK